MKYRYVPREIKTDSQKDSRKAVAKQFEGRELEILGYVRGGAYANVIDRDDASTPNGKVFADVPVDRLRQI